MPPSLVIDSFRNGLCCLFAGLISVAAATRSARAEYPERNIDLVIPYAAGGGFDLYGRAVGKAMEPVLPKGIVVVPRNVPGGAGTKGITAMARAAPDGYTIGLVDMPGGVAPMIAGEAVGYDLDRVTWLGVINVGVYSLVVGKGSPFQTLEAFRSQQPREPFMATTGSNDLAMTRIVLSALGVKAKLLTGYNGGPETHLAVMRGEADASLGMDVMIEKHLRSGAMRQLLWFQRKDARGAPAGVSSADDVGHPELANIGLYRLIAAPPALAAPVKAMLQRLVQAALGSNELAQWSKATQFPIDPGSPEDAHRLYREQKAFLEQHRDALLAK